MKKISIYNNITIYYDIDFDKNIADLDLGKHAEDWPVTYILYNRSKGKAYVGETTGFKGRMNSHLDDSEKDVYNKALFVDYDKASKSTILRLEAFLIRGLSVSHETLSDLSNKKMDSNNHTYYNKKQDEKMFENVWNTLKNVGIVQETYDSIRNKNEFKYSPYIFLNDNQNKVLNEIIDELLEGKTNTIVVEGASGTGKSAVAIQLFKQLTNYNNFNGIINNSMIGENIDRLFKIKEMFCKPDTYYSIAYVAPMNNFCSIIRKSISKIPELRKKDLLKNKTYINDVDLEKLRVYSGLELKRLAKYVKKGEKLFDLIIVDEAQRLNRRYNQSNGNGYLAFDVMNKALGLPANKNRDDGNQLDWIYELSHNQVFFYDKKQTIRSSDVPTEYIEKNFELATKKKLVVEERCLGGTEYIDYVSQIFSSTPPKEKKKFDNYEFEIFDNYDDMVRALTDNENDLSIRVAGYFFESSEHGYDVEIDGVRQNWNQVSSNWINNKNRKDNEIGCVHVIEGIDADYVGVIVGDEIFINDNGEIDVNRDNYKDKLGKQCIDDNEQLIRFITNIYYILLTRAMKGTYLYVKDPTMKEYLLKYINKSKK